MNPTAASETRRGGKTLNLRDKIFELHDAVKTLQTKQTKIERQNVGPKKDMAGEVRSNTSRIEVIEGQCGVLKQALGTFADAVSEEIEELQRGIREEMDCKLSRLEARLEDIALGQASRETENAKVSFEVRNLKAQLV